MSATSFLPFESCSGGAGTNFVLYETMHSVCFCLWVPWVCHNFVYKRATTPIEVLMRYFVGRELGTANMLCRHFDWSSNILWPQDEIPNLLDPHHTRFFLAGMDSILNAKETREYLREHGVRDTNEGASKEAPEGVERGGMIVGWEQAHGEMLMHDGKVSVWGRTRELVSKQGQDCDWDWTDSLLCLLFCLPACCVHRASQRSFAG